MKLGVIGRGVHGMRYVRHIEEADNLELMWTQGRVGIKNRNLDSVDGVVIASPPNSHFDYAYALGRAGKYVLIEKPMTASVNTAQTLADSGFPIMVAHTMRWNESVNAAILAGAMDAHYVHLVLCLEHEERFTLGPLRDHGVHLIDLARYITGSEIATIEGARGSVLHYTDECPRVQAVMRMTSGQQVEFEVDEGLGGRYSFVEWRGRYSGIQPLASPPTIPKVLQSFRAGALRGSFPCDAWDGLQVARAVEAIGECASTGSPHVLRHSHRPESGGTFTPRLG